MEKIYNGHINANINSAICIKSNQNIVLGSSGVLELKLGSKTGKVIESFDVSSDRILISAWELIVQPSNPLPYESEIYLTMTDGFIVSAVNGSSFSGFDVNGNHEFKFNTENSIGKPLDGGIVISKTNEVFTIISPKKSEMNLTWYEIDKAIQKTEADTGTTGWYLPSFYEIQQYRNKLTVDEYYWTSTEIDSEHSYTLNTNSQVPYKTNKKESHPIRLLKKITPTIS